MMKKVLGTVLASLLAVGVSVVFAGGDGCCAAGKAKGAAMSACDMSTKLNLTDAQKTKLATLQENVKHATSTSEGKAIFEKGITEILTPEQLAQCKASCEKAKAGGCPFMNKADK